MAGIVCMLVEQSMTGIQPATTALIAANLSSNVEIIDSTHEMLVVHLKEGGKNEILQLSRLMRSLYQQMNDGHDNQHTYFGAVKFDGDDEERNEATQLAKRMALDCLHDGNRRISCVDYRK